MSLSLSRSSEDRARSTLFFFFFFAMSSIKVGSVAYVVSMLLLIHSVSVHSLGG